MKTLALFVLLFALPACTQTLTVKKEGPIVTLSQAMTVREKLIKKYILQTHQLKSVSVCGDDDVFRNEENYLRVEAYSDTIRDFNRDAFDGEGDTMRIDGVRLLIITVPRKK